MSVTKDLRPTNGTAVPESQQYLLGRAFASAFVVDPTDPESVLFRVRMAMRVAERIESTCGWTDAVREGFRAGAVVDPLAGSDELLVGVE